MGCNLPGKQYPAAVTDCRRSTCRCVHTICCDRENYDEVSATPECNKGKADSANADVRESLESRTTQHNIIASLQDPSCPLGQTSYHPYHWRWHRDGLSGRIGDGPVRDHLRQIPPELPPPAPDSRQSRGK